MNAVTLKPIAWRLTRIERDGFGQAIVLRRGTITLEPEIKRGERHGGYKAPDTFEFWHVEVVLPWLPRWRVRRYLHRDAHIALEFWTETDVASNGDRFVHWLFPSLRWNGKGRGRTFTGTFMPADDPTPDGQPAPNGAFWKTDRVPV